MQIAPLFNYQIKSFNGENVSQKQNYPSSVMKNNAADSFSFKGVGRVNGNVEEINKNAFPDELYLNIDEVLTRLENEDTGYHRWERFKFVLAKLLAKRCDYLGLINNAKYGGISYSDGRVFISVYELPKDTDYDDSAKNLEFDWTKGYKELSAFFDGTQEWPIGARDNMEIIREELPEILRKQGWIK